ncbi:MAG: hypothetical protein WBB82_03625 [Limnothrix sp.]
MAKTEPLGDLILRRSPALSANRQTQKGMDFIRGNPAAVVNLVGNLGSSDEGI